MTEKGHGASGQAVLLAGTVPRSRPCPNLAASLPSTEGGSDRSRAAPDPRSYRKTSFAAGSLPLSLTTRIANTRVRAIRTAEPSDCPSRVSRYALTGGLGHLKGLLPCGLNWRGMSRP